MPAVSRDSASTRLSTPNGDSFIRIGPTVLLLLLRIGVPCSSLLPRGGCAPQKPESPSSSSSSSSASSVVIAGDDDVVGDHDGDDDSCRGAAVK